MTNRELLERAAKAAGYTSHGYGELCGGDPCLLLKEADFTGMWAPLTDDGDALRLAVKLRLTIDIERDRCCVSVGDHSGRFGVQPWGDDGPEAATRRAIVRAAAAIQAPGATPGREAHE